LIYILNKGLEIISAFNNGQHAMLLSTALNAAMIALATSTKLNLFFVLDDPNRMDVNFWLDAECIAYNAFSIH